MTSLSANAYALTPSLETATDGRRAALYDIAYLIVSFAIYLSAVVAPFVGIAAGLFLWLAGSHQSTKRVGKISILCAALGFVVYVAVYVLAFVVMGAAAANSAASF